MNAIIDTSSLLALVRYYLPFDEKDKLKTLVQEKFEKNEFVIIDKVFSEARYQSKGIILSELDFINKSSKKIINTDNILPDNKFFNRLENEFCNKDIRRSKGINEAEFESAKTSYLETADAKIILYGYNQKKKNFILQDNIVVITEETASGNDGKIFKKIPDICSLIGIDCCGLPTLFKNYYNINLSEFLH